jgi:O-antigen/teichoic acid export membrane protein
VGELADSADAERHSRALAVLMATPIASRVSRYTRNIGVMVGQSLVQRVIGLATTFVLARSLGAAAFGAYSVVANTSSSAFGLVRLGVDAAIHVNVAEQPRDAAARERKGELLGAGLAVLLTSSIAAALLCLSLADWLAAAVFGDPALAKWIRFAAAAVLFQSVSQFCYVALAGLQRFVEYGRVMVLGSLGSAVCIATAAVAGGLFPAVVALVATQGVVAVWLADATRRALERSGIRFSWRRFGERARELVATGFPFYGAGLVSIPVTYYMQGLLTSSSGLHALGYLRVITALVMIVSFVPTSAAGPMISMLAQSRSEDESSMARNVMRNVKMMFVFGVLVASILTISLPWLVPSLFGVGYLPAAGAAGISLGSAVLAAVGAVIGNALFSARRVDLVFMTAIVQGGVFGAAGAWLIPAHGLLGYVIAELMGWSMLLFVSFVASRQWLSRHRVEAAWLIRMLLPVAVLLGYACVQAASDAPPSVVRAAVAFICLAGACVWGYRTILDRDERNALRRLAGFG